MAKLIITQDGQDKIYEIADDEFTIGSGAEADLVIRDDDISGLHLSVKKTRAGFQLIDMETKAGTNVNGKPVNSHLLHNGDTIEMGDVRMTYIGGGPKRAAAAGGGRRRPAAKKTNIERTGRSHYRRETWDSKLGGGGMATIAIAALVLLGVVGWLIFGNQKPREASNFTRIKNVAFEIRNNPGEETFANAEKELEKIGQIKDLELKEKQELRKTKKLLADLQMNKKRAETLDSAQQDFVRLKNLRRNNPNDIEGLKKAAKEFIAKYPNTGETDDAKMMLEELENDPGDSPERRELARLEAEVNKMVWRAKKADRQFRKAYEMLQNVDPGVEAIYSDELESMRKRLWGKSQMAMGVRKNDVRDLIRQGKDAEARAAMAEMFDKLIRGNFEEYMKFPDGGYRNPETTKNEKKTQELIREFLNK